MSKKENEALCSFRLNPKLFKKLEKSIRRRGFPSRSSYFNAVVRVTVGEDEGEIPLPPKVKEWIDKNKPPLTETEIKKHLEELIRNLLF
ncbi:MAG: hypothetical protein Q4Q25_03525, partial [Methanocorpusculum sp.]|nr:hypothetical protein [Methanocorpusculum sp.]